MQIFLVFANFKCTANSTERFVWHSCDEMKMLEHGSIGLSIDKRKNDQICSICWLIFMVRFCALGSNSAYSTNIIDDFLINWLT